MTYLDGRVVKTPYDEAEHLQQVRFASFGGQPESYNYWTASGYAPNGAPTGTALGNGLVNAHLDLTP